MNSVNVFSHQSGPIYIKKIERDDGMFLCIENSGYSSSHPHVGHFTNIAFDNSGIRFIVSDHLGHLFYFDLLRQRYDHLMHSRLVCTALNFSLRDKDTFLMALVDNTVRCQRIGQSDQVAVLRGHGATVTGISVHCSGRFALTTDPDSTFLWDLTTFERMRKLNVKEEVQLISFFFVPASNLIMTAFRDDTLFLWDSENLQCRSNLVVPGDENSGPRYRSLSCSADGHYLIAGGRARQIHVWDLVSGELKQNFELPPSAESSGAVRQISFAEDENSALVLTHSGRLKVVSLSSGVVQSQLEDKDVSKFCLAKDKLAVISSGQLRLYTLKALLHPETPRSSRPSAPTIVGPPPQIITDRSDSSKRTYTIEKPSNTLAKTTKNSPKKPAEPLDRKKLRAVLLEFGQFPGKYRLLIWKTLLQLPGNASAFSALFEKGIHPAFEALEERYPLRSQKLLRVMQRVLSCIAHWSPLFGEAEFLPLLAFPFIRLFQNNQLQACEAVMTILLNWAGLWFEYFPNPPLNILGMVENLVAYHDKELYAHLCARGVTSDVFAWPLLQTVFTEVLTRESWLSLWDHLLCHPPGYLLYSAAAFTLVNRQPLLRMGELREFEVFYRHAGALNVRDLIKQSKQVRSATPKDICPCQLLGSFTPLTVNSYPAFNRYPVYIVDYQVRERARLRQEEQVYLQERRAAELAAKRAAAAQAASESWSRQQEQLLEAEARRRELLQLEESRLAEQRRRLAALQRETKLSEIQTLQTARLQMTALQTKQQQAEIRRLDDQLASTVARRSAETERTFAQADLLRLDAELDRWRLDADDDEGEDISHPLSHSSRRVCPQDAASALSDIDSVCADNSRLEEEVGALLRRLQKARLRIPEGSSADSLSDVST